MIRLLLTLSISMMIACASARQVEMRPGEGGIIATSKGLFQNEEAAAKADAMMKSVCGSKKIKIVKEGEAVVGQTTQSNSNTTGNSTTNATGVRNQNLAVGQSRTRTTSTTTGSATTRDVTEWRKEFVCEPEGEADSN